MKNPEERTNRQLMSKMNEQAIQSPSGYPTTGQVRYIDGIGGSKSYC